MRASNRFEALNLDKLDIILGEVEEKFESEYDVDSDGEGGWTRCSRGILEILEEDYTNLTDSEYVYIEEQLEGCSIVSR